MSRPKDEFPDLADAMDLWREDTERVVARIDVHGALAEGDLADRVVAEALAARSSSLSSSLSMRGPSPARVRAYAAAAVILIGVGVVGTLLTRPLAAREARTPRWAVLGEEVIDELAQDPYYEPALGR